jgi:hypothetical protein
VEDDLMALRRPFTREQRLTIVYGMLAFALTLVILQLWLLTATMNAYLGGDESVIWPAAFASLACLALNAGLLIYLGRVGSGRIGSDQVGSGLIRSDQVPRASAIGSVAGGSRRASPPFPP